MSKNLGIFVNNWIFGNAKLSEVLKRVASIGLDGIELVGEPELYKPSEVNKMTGDYNIKVQSICGMHPGPDKDDLRALCHYDATERKKAIRYVHECVDLAIGVKARSVLVVPSLVGQPAYFRNKRDDLKFAIESIAKAGEYAEKQKIILTIEPINRYEVGLVNSIDDGLKMAKEINNPFVRIMGDTFHMQIEEGDGIPDAIRRAGGCQFQHLHCADNTREAPGRGTMDWKEIIRALLDINYEGGISMEPLPRGASPYDAREGNIPKEKLDAGLKYGYEHLRRLETLVREYTSAK